MTLSPLSLQWLLLFLHSSRSTSPSLTWSSRKTCYTMARRISTLWRESSSTWWGAHCILAPFFSVTWVTAFSGFALWFVLISPLLSHSSNPCSRPAVWDPSTQDAHWCHSGRSIPNTNSAEQVNGTEKWASQLFGCIYSHHSLIVKY